MSWLTDIFDFILPPRCLQCGKILQENTGLCSSCFDEINFITQPYCHKCGHPLDIEVDETAKVLCGNCLKKPNQLFRYMRSSFCYDEVGKPLVLNFKFHDKTENARFLAQTMYVAGRDIFTAGVDVIVPVPLHFSRLLMRRYNQSSLLANELSKLSNLPMDCRSLCRHIKTRPQVELSGLARVQNVKGAFSVKSTKKISGKRILLIDDVLTTGSTIKECARALKKSGAKSVDVLTIARVI